MYLPGSQLGTEGLKPFMCASKNPTKSHEKSNRPLHCSCTSSASSALPRELPRDLPEEFWHQNGSKYVYIDLHPKNGWILQNKITSKKSREWECRVAAKKCGIHSSFKLGDLKKENDRKWSDSAAKIGTFAPQAGLSELHIMNDSPA